MAAPVNSAQRIPGRPDAVFDIFGPAHIDGSLARPERPNVSKLRVSHYRSPQAMQNLARNPTEAGLIVCLSTLPLPIGKYEMRTMDRPVQLPHIPGFRTNVIDVGLEPACWIGSAFDFVHYHVPQSHLNSIAEDLKIGSVRDFRFAINQDDFVAAQMTKSLIPFAETKTRPCQFAQDQFALILGAHVLQKYAINKHPIRPPKGGLAPWQKRRARELLMENLDGNLYLESVAKECGLSASHFSRAFKTSFGVSSHRWLIERRVERAQELLRMTALPLIEIAMQSGFRDQAAFSRTFHKSIGMSPGRWRRHIQSGSSAPHSTMLAW